MKSIKLLALLFVASTVFYSCSDDPEVVNEEEVITTLTATLTPTSGTAITLKSQDLDGDGPNQPTITVSGNLAANTTYTGKIVLLNETENPAENITEEVEKEAKEHQFFYTIASSLNITATATNKDSDGNPLGTEFSLVTGAASSGNLTFTLRHEPTKPNSGLSTAGGETDIEVTFAVTVQ